MQLQVNVLRRAASSEELQLYRAALEWDLQDPIVIESRKDLKSESTWRGRLEPFHHQVSNLITFCRRLPVTLLADDVGLGKTVSAGLIASELISRNRVTRILVVCPKLLGPQWKEELEAKFSIPATVVAGRDLIDAESDGVGAIITTYHSARMYLDQVPQDRFQMLVLDEAHKLRNLYGTERAPKVATCFQNAFQQRRFPFVLMLTATPIQNRLWDLYSLVDLLTTARGHKNPFGSEGVFARKYIADGRTQARHLKSESQDEFRAIVYGYMSRVRRGDARLYFPDRVVQLHRVKPTAGELTLIGLVAKGIEKLNRLAQISVLQALASSPDALSAQLLNMARKGTVPSELASEVSALTKQMPASAKLAGLGTLVEQLKGKDPERWRIVVFTGRLETQTTIQMFLEQLGLTVGLINGSSGPRNQDTLSNFRANPPRCRAIVSTEAGSEGVNLQVANVVVNFDLPWNPMIVEQRIGRVQRLASEHAKVAIFNIILSGTFEEYIVARLMEKLQMASHAVGDVESLLQAAGMDEDEAPDVTSFAEKVRQLVVAALLGKDVAEAVRQAEQSISDAKNELEREEENINSMLGRMDGAEYVGPKLPQLPSVTRSMTVPDFSRKAFQNLGGAVKELGGDIVEVDWQGEKETVTFAAGQPGSGRYYAAGTPSFAKLVDKIIAGAVHDVVDEDDQPEKRAKEQCSTWMKSIQANLRDFSVNEVHRCFRGNALVRVRVAVAHDSYERLVDVACNEEAHRRRAGKPGLWPLGAVIDNPNSIGLDLELVEQAATLDEPIAEFRRFYLERRGQETKAAGDDDRKRRKLEDDFTPRIELSLASLSGVMHRELACRVRYDFDGLRVYESNMTVRPRTGELVDAPPLARCVVTGHQAPVSCLKQCQISKGSALAHLLVASEISGRLGLPQFSILCSASGKTILQDEAAQSSASGKLVAIAHMLRSALSGKLAEPNYFTNCEFTDESILQSESSTSELSGKRYRKDQEGHSGVSSRRGHTSEFIKCQLTHVCLAPDEAKSCAATGAVVRSTLLKRCDVTGSEVLPSELETCSVSKKHALTSLMITSSVGGSRFLADLGLRSRSGRACKPDEAVGCTWSGRKEHPEDMRVCELTRLSVHVDYCVNPDQPRMRPLIDLLEGTRTGQAFRELWDVFADRTSAVIGKKRCRIEAGIVSPNQKVMALCAEVRTLMGLRTTTVGVILALEGGQILGRPVSGRRTSRGWVETP